MSRSLEENRKSARRILREKVDLKINGENSVTAKKQRAEIEKVRRKKAKAKRRHEIREAAKQKDKEAEMSRECGAETNIVDHSGQSGDAAEQGVSVNEGGTCEKSNRD